MNTPIAAQPISSSIFYHSYDPESDANCADWLPCENTLCQELPNKSTNEVKQICQSKNFTDIQSHFLQNITRLKDLVKVYIDDDKTKNTYAKKIDVFYNKIKNPWIIHEKKLLPLFNHTCRQICRIVLTLEQHQSESTESKNAEKTKHSTLLKKEEIVAMLTDVTNDINLCLPGVYTRFQYAYEQIDAIKNQSNLPTQIANIKTQLLNHHTQAFMQQQQRMQKLTFDDSMEIHYFNYFNNLVCQQLGLKPITDANIPHNKPNKNVEHAFLLQTSLHVNSFTIINKLVEQWSEQLSNILEQNGLSAWLEKAIPDKKLTAEYTDVISSQFIEPINYLLANEASEPLTLHDLFEIDESYTTYSLVDFKEKLTAFAAQVFFGKDTTQIIPKLPGKQGESLCIGTTDHNFFWVFENNSLSNAAEALNRDNYTALQLSHLKTIDFNNLDEHTRSALLIQALEQTDNIDDVTSFFLDKKILKTLQNLSPAARQTIFAKLDNKISVYTPDQKNTAIKNIIYHLTTLASTSKQPLQLKDLECWTNTSLLEPLLCRLKENKVKIRAITAALNSSQVDTFSHQSMTMLFSAQQCQTFFKQALQLKHTGFIIQLLLTEYCSEQISSQEQQKALLELFTEKGSTRGLEYLLGKINTTIDYNDGDKTPLHLAARYGHTHCIKLLLEKNFIDVNYRDPLDDTALHIALKQGFTELAELLINRSDIAVNQKNSLGHTALHLAAMKDQTKCVELLLTKHDIDINKTDNKGYTPLHLAAINGQLDCVKLLLAQDQTDINKTDENGNTLLQLAVIFNQTEVIQLLLAESDIDINKTGQNSYTALHLAAINGKIECAKLLLAKSSIDINKTDNKGYTPLHLAAINGQPDCVKLLLAQDQTDINKTNKNGNTPLHLAVMFNQTEVIQLLLAESDIDINKTGQNSYTALHLAAINGKIEYAKLLLAKSSIEINKPLSSGHTPLHLAAINGQLDCAKLLLAKSSIEINKPLSSGHTPLHLAAINGQPDCVKLLLAQDHIDINKTDKSGNTPLHSATISGKKECVQLLLTQDHIAINKTDKSGNTPLHLAAMNGHSDIVELMIQTIPNIKANQPNSCGHTALHLAANNAHVHCVKSLITKTNINQLNQQHRTALHAAASGQTEGHTQCVELLIAQDSMNINAKNKNGLTAAEIARRNQNEESFKLLKSHSKRLKSLSNRLKYALGRFTDKHKGTYTLPQAEMETPNKQRSELPTTDIDHALNPEVGSNRMLKTPGLLRRFKKGTYIVTDASLDKKQQTIDSEKYFSKGVFHKISQDTSTVLQEQEG